MKKILAIAAILLSIAACTEVNKRTSAVKLPDYTELLGTLDEGCLGDSIHVMLTDNAAYCEFKAYPILDESFAITLPADKMKFGSFMIIYDGGVTSGNFIPEGGKIYIHMDRKGKIKIRHENENSLTGTYNSMTREIVLLNARLAKENMAAAKEGNLDKTQIDSLQALKGNAISSLVEKQSIEIVKTHRDDVLGLLGILNLIGTDHEKDIPLYLKGMDETIRNHAAIPDSLRVLAGE